MRPSTGNVMVDGRVAALLELGSGFNPDFTGKENVYLNASLFGLSKQEIDSKFNSIIAFSEIEDFINQPVKTYSSGMLLRLAFSVVAHVDADLLIIDEALAVGDVHFTQKCMNFIREFKKNGSLILVTHDHVAVQHVCDRCLWLENGKVRELGNVKKVTQNFLYCINKNALKQKELHSLDNNKVQVIAVNLKDNNGNEISNIKGNESVELRVGFKVLQNLKNLGVGFIVKNSHGLELFAKNTFNQNSLSDYYKSGVTYSAVFNFKMPVLPIGEYTVSVAIAEFVDFEKFKFHYWVDGALTFKSLVENSKNGLVGIPIESFIKVSYLK
jgi:lipopolysaccharide transport system ATP-binding protein